MEKRCQKQAQPPATQIKDHGQKEKTTLQHRCLQESGPRLRAEVRTSLRTGRDAFRGPSRNFFTGSASRGRATSPSGGSVPPIR